MPINRADLRRAFAEDEFFPAFQPQVELRTRQLVGFEVLARWRHRRLGEVQPDVFIPVLEKCELIDTLTQVLLEKACATPVLRDSEFALSINISPVQLLGFENPDRLASIVAKHCFPLNRLTIEITESALLSDLERAQAAVRGLKALGCKLSLDDFGTGYSSLKHLHALPFDELKIDKSFVATMLQKRQSRKIVASVIGLGQSLGLRTVAEGVESNDQVNMLLWLGCEIGQGWYYGKPTPAEDLERVIAGVRLDASADAPENLDEEESLLAGLEAVPSQRLAQLQAIYDGAPVGMCFLDRSLRYVSLNRKLAKMNGVPVVAHLGRRVDEVIPHVFPLVEPFIRQSLEGEAVIGVEFTKPTRDESAQGQSILASYQPVRDEAGEVLGVSVALMDITERKRLEESLRETEEHFRLIASLQPHMHWVLNTSGEVIEIGAKWEEMTGQKPEEALGDGWMKMVHPDDLPIAKDGLRISLKAGQPQQIEFRVRRANREWVHVRARGSSRFGPSGKALCFYGVLEEVQDRAAASPEMVTRLDKLRKAVDALPFGIVIADAQCCTISMLNSTAKVLYGDDFVPGMTLPEYTRLRLKSSEGTSLKPYDYPLARAILRSEVVDDEEFTLERQGSPPIHLAISSRPIYDNGKLIGGISAIRVVEFGRVN